MDRETIIITSKFITEKKKECKQNNVDIIFPDRWLCKNLTSTSPLALFTKMYKPIEDTERPVTSGFDANWIWDVRNKSCNVLIDSRNLRNVYFHPRTSVGTGAIRSNKQINNLRCYWEIEIECFTFGTSTMFGIGTKHARLGIGNYVDLLGDDEHSWGLSYKGYTYHDGEYKAYTNLMMTPTKKTIGLLYDGSAGTLSYYHNGEYLGVAFTGLHMITEPLYPMVSTTASRMKMSMKNVRVEVPTIKEYCRDYIIRYVGGVKGFGGLELPKPLKDTIKPALIYEGICKDPVHDMITVHCLN